MTKREIVRSPRTARAAAPDDGEAPVKVSADIVRGVDFRLKRRERIYDPDRIWSGEHTIRDYIEL